MKLFIYLDTDIVNSIIAQKDNGLISEISKSDESTSAKTTQKNTQFSSEGKIEGGLSKLIKAQGSIALSADISNGNLAQSVFKEIETKTLHDAAFDLAYEEIKADSSLKHEDADLGAFVELNGLFKVIDFEYLEKLFSKDSLLEFLKKNSKNEIEAKAKGIESELNREQRRHVEAERKKELQHLINDSNQQYDAISEIINVIKQVIPYNRMLLSSEGYLIPLEDNYFRDNPSTIGFKHGGYITCVGYITNTIGKTSAPHVDNVFATVQHSVNEVIRSLLPTAKEDLFVLHPIALYYGK